VSHSRFWHRLFGQRVILTSDTLDHNTAIVVRYMKLNQLTNVVQRSGYCPKYRKLAEEEIMERKLLGKKRLILNERNK